MLSHENNETLVRVGKGTPMGELFRLHWIPFLPSKDLLADGPPKRIRLLGEDLIAFRDTDGRVALFDTACPHRGAPLIYARNEECGLRCVYHGWKFDLSGTLVDAPAEPPASNLVGRVHLKSYPCQERNGVIWTYMRERATELPPLPNLEWNMVAPEQVHVSVRVQECNWLQALEGEIDSAHGGFLHGRIDAQGRAKHVLYTKDLRPKYEIVRQEFGMSAAARRILEQNKYYWRVTQFVLPFYTLVPPQAAFSELSGHAWVPIDDEHTLAIMFSYHPNAPLYEKTRRLFEIGNKGRDTGHSTASSMRNDNRTAPYFGYWTKFNSTNDFNFDFESQRTTYFSGLPGLWVQDAGLQAGLTPIFDRTKERLASSDAAIVVARRILLDVAKGYRDTGQIPKSAIDPNLAMVRAVSLHLTPKESWLESGRELMKAELGKGFGYDP